jgi:hypothetical protein
MRFVPVILLGLLSAAVSLLAVYALNRAGMNIMGWYASLIPVGAGLIGLGASSGFGLGSWWSGQRLDGRLLVLVILMLTSAYFVAEYVEWQVLYPEGVVDADGRFMGFWSYFDHMSRAIHFGRKPELGPLGYGVRALEVAGFVGGGVFGTLMLLNRPHCVACSRYQRVTPVALLPGDAQAPLDAITAAIQDGYRLNEALLSKAPLSMLKETERLDERMSLLLVHCPMCTAGELRVDLVAGEPAQRIGQRVTAYPLGATVVSDFLRARSNTRPGESNLE